MKKLLAIAGLVLAALGVSPVPGLAQQSPPVCAALDLSGCTPTDTTTATVSEADTTTTTATYDATLNTISNDHFGIGVNWSGNMGTWDDLVATTRVRLFDSCNASNCVYWQSLCSSGVSGGAAQCNFTPLDDWLGRLKTANISKIILNISRTPAFARSGAYGGCATNWPDGGCQPPKNMTDVTNYVKALHNHVTSWQTSNGYSFSQIAWEGWNEPNGNFFAGWPSSVSVLVAVQKAIYQAVKGYASSKDIVLSPPFQGCGSYNDLNTFLNAGGGSYADAISFHYYCTPDVTSNTASPEYSTNYVLVGKIRTVMSNHGILSKQLWNTEYGWGSGVMNRLCSEDQAAAWVIRKTVLGFWQGVYVSNFYQVDQTGHSPTLWIPSGGHNDCGGSWTSGLQESGQAWNYLRSIMVGNAVNGCSNSGSVWHCNINNGTTFFSQVWWTTTGSSSIGFPYSSGHSVTMLGVATSRVSGNTISFNTLPVYVRNN